MLLSTNAGATLLAANCSPATYGGELLGYFDYLCEIGLARSGRMDGLDASERSRISARLALRNVRESLHRIPIVVLARLGRLIAIFRPSQTVALTAQWMLTPTWPIWIWVTSCWLLIVLALVGVRNVDRTNRALLPLLGPSIIAVVVAALTYGDLRYHTLADLGVIVLAAVGFESLIGRSSAFFQRSR